MDNSVLTTVGRNQEKPIVSRCDPSNSDHPAAGGAFDTARRAQSTSPVFFAHKTLEDRRNRRLGHSNESAVGIDPMPATADPDTTSWLHFPGPDNDSGRQLELDLHLTDARPHIDSIADRLEIESERRLANQLAQ